MDRPSTIQLGKLPVRSMTDTANTIADAIIHDINKNFKLDSLIASDLPMIIQGFAEVVDTLTLSPTNLREKYTIP